MMSRGSPPRFALASSSAIVAAATAIAASAAASATGPASAAAATESSLGLRSGFIHHQRASIHLMLVELADRLLRIVVARHLDERKPARAPGRHVPHHPDVVYLARPAEQLGELVFRGGIREVADVESPAHAVTYSC